MNSIKMLAWGSLKICYTNLAILGIIVETVVFNPFASSGLFHASNLEVHFLSKGCLVYLFLLFIIVPIFKYIYVTLGMNGLMMDTSQ